MTKRNPTPMNTEARMLRAGPIRMKFQDGELRYLTVAGREIVRRVYFAVRDKDFDTPPPVFSVMDVQATDESFSIRLSAECRNDFSHFSWNGTIEGGGDGRITFAVAGQAGREFASPRVGLNVLYGVGALAGEAFETVAADGTVRRHEFPRDVAPERWDYGNWFNTLRYRTAQGLMVTARLEGGYAGIEDQRNYCDTSYKVYAYLPYAYPTVPAGQELCQTLTIEVGGDVPKAAAREPAPVLTAARVRLGRTIEGAKMPAIVAPSHRPKGFDAVNKQQELRQAKQVCWLFNPAAHLTDDDTFMENIPAVLDQVRIVRRWAPRAAIRIDPIGFDSRHPRPRRDARNHTAFGAAWCAAVAKYLAMGEVDQAAFAVGPGAAQSVQAELARLTGRRVRAVEIDAPVPSPVEALAVEDNGATLLWLVNLTNGDQEVTVENLPPHARLSLKNVAVNGRGRHFPPLAASGEGTARVSLAAYEIVQIHFAS